MRKYWKDRETIRALNKSLYNMYGLKIRYVPMFGECVDCVPDNEPYITRFCYWVRSEIIWR